MNLQACQHQPHSHGFTLLLPLSPPFARYSVLDWGQYWLAALRLSCEVTAYVTRFRKSSHPILSSLRAITCGPPHSSPTSPEVLLRTHPFPTITGDAFKINVHLFSSFLSQIWLPPGSLFTILPDRNNLSTIQALLFNVF